MSSRTYLPTLVAILHKVCTYIVRYRHVIIEFIPPSAIPLLDAVSAACKAFTDAVELPGGV